MNYHIATSRALDLHGIERDACAGKRPRHVLSALKNKLGAELHQPGALPVSRLDRLHGAIGPKPQNWALARTLSAQCTPDDFIFCMDEEIGIPIAARCGAKRARPKIGVYFHNMDRPRARFAMAWFRLAGRIDLVVVNCRAQSDFLKRALGIPSERIMLLPEQTDTQFFKPGPSSPHNRPVIVSVGLERRDYVTLAASTGDLDVDVRISGYSESARAPARAFPNVIPPNMTRRFYDWRELVRLYRDADLVAVCLLESKSAAGITVINEAMACRRPVIVTRTKGIGEYVEPQGIATTVPSGDVTALRRAIVDLLNHPEAAEAQAQLGYEWVVRHRNSEGWVDALTGFLTTV